MAEHVRYEVWRVTGDGSEPCNMDAGKYVGTSKTNPLRRVAALERLIVAAHKLDSMYDSGVREEAIRLMRRDVVASGGCGKCLGEGQVYDGHDPDDGWTKCPKCEGTGTAATRLIRHKPSETKHTTFEYDESASSDGPKPARIAKKRKAAKGGA